jgi:hypothetical protein
MNLNNYDENDEEEEGEEEDGNKNILIEPKGSTPETILEQLNPEVTHFSVLGTACIRGLYNPS